MFQAFAFAARRRADGCWQHVNMRAVEKFFLDAVITLALGELLVGQLAVERNDPWEIFFQLAGENEAAFRKILASQLLDGFRGALDKVRQANAKFDDAAV